MLSFLMMSFGVAVFVFKSLNKASRSPSMYSGFSWCLNRVKTDGKQTCAFTNLK